jgi:membrane associated rhomboid family serine protease
MEYRREIITSLKRCISVNLILLAFLMPWEFLWFRWIRLPAWFVLVLWILFQIIGTLEQKAGMSSVSSAAHLCGAALGVLACLLWRKLNEPRLLE